MKLAKHFIEWMCIVLIITYAVVLPIALLIAFVELSIWPLAWVFVNESGRLLTSIILGWSGIMVAIYKGQQEDLLVFDEGGL